MTETTEALGTPRSLLSFLREGRAGGARARAEKTPRTRRTAKQWVAMTMLVVLPLIAIMGIFGGVAAHADGDSSTDSDSMQYSFYKASSSLTAFFSTEQEPGSEGFSGSWKTIIGDPSSAGSLLGYADPNFSSVSGWLASKLSGSSDAIGYDTLEIHNSDGTTSSKYNGMVNYAYYGASLKGLGLDSTSTGLSLGMMKWVSGGIVMLLFVLGGAVDFVFNGVVSVLGMLNPFKLFYVGVNAVSPNLANGMVGNGAHDVGPLSGVANWIGGWYQALMQLSWSVMVPMFIAILLFSLFLFKKMDRGGAFKKIVVRVVFIGIGLPLLGTMYTGSINALADAQTSGNTASARVVMSTYVNFEDWATNSRLAVPSGATIAWDTSKNAPSGIAQANIRNTALAINNSTYNLGLTPITSASSYDASWAAQIMSGRTAENNSSDTFSTVVDMLSAYMGGQQISGASFETNAKGDLTQSPFYTGTSGTGDAKKNGATVQKWFDNLTKKADDLNGETGTDDPTANPLIATSTSSTAGLEATSGKVRTFSTPDYDSCKASGTKISTDDGTPRSCNLTPLAMYNYLNTDFGPTSMKMYSSSSVASEATRSVHNSVDQVGTGAMSFLYWLDAVVLLGSFVFIGLGYAFALLFGSFRRSFQILSATPFATLGAIPAIAKVIVYAIALLLETVVTIFVYKIVTEFLTSLPQIIEEPFASTLSGDKTSAFAEFLTSGWGFSLVVTLLSIIGVVGFTVLAMRVRKSIVKAIEETVTKLVETFLGTQVGMPGGGKLAPALAGGLASGTGSAMANRMMTGGKGAIAGELPGGKGPNGPDGITTAGGTIATGPGPDGDTQLSISADGGPADGNGDQGSGMKALEGPDRDEAAKEVALGRDIEVNGLSKPGETREVEAGEALDTAMNSAEQSQEAYKEADQKRLQAGTEAAKATGHAAIAAGRAAAGDEVGAAQSGGKAIEAGGAAVAANERAKQKEQDAGRSSLDAPNRKHAQAAAKADRVSQLGGQVSKVAGAANGSAGGVQAAKSGAKALPTKAAPKGQTAVQAPRPVQQPAPAQNSQKADQALRQSQRALARSGVAQASSARATGTAQQSSGKSDHPIRTANEALSKSQKAPAAPRAPKPVRAPRPDNSNRK